jgi:hypothetical protein
LSRAEEKPEQEIPVDWSFHIRGLVAVLSLEGRSVATPASPEVGAASGFLAVVPGRPGGNADDERSVSDAPTTVKVFVDGDATAG